MKSNCFKIFVFLFFVVVTVFFLYYLRPLTDDELFNYGFGRSILEGRVPYLDFNMIIPPVFPYFMAFILTFFGEKLIVYHVLVALMVVLVSFLGYRKIGVRSIFIYLFLLIYPYTGYNMFVLCLFMFLLVVPNHRKNYDFMEAILISLMFLSKQTLGILVIPSIVFAKKKKKVVLIYFVAIMCLGLYLVWNNSLYEFLDYCVLGMFNFGASNGTGINFLLFVEFFVIFFLAFIYYKKRDRKVIYVLFFQVMSFPIVDYFHFVVSFVPVIYIVFDYYKLNFYGRYFFSVILLFFLIIFYIIIFKESFFSMNTEASSSFMEGRVINSLLEDSVLIVLDFYSKHEDEKFYFFGIYSYLYKLSLDESIDKYDLINNGNMGYLGEFQYIREVEDYCMENVCYFVMSDLELLASSKTQTNRRILKYVKNNYSKVYGAGVVSFYTNA